MHLIVYTSEATFPADQIEDVLAEIVANAKHHNADNGITGVLFYENRHFFQALEGEEAAVRGTFDKIAQDSRHRNLVKLKDAPIGKRSFPDWSMDSFYIESTELIDAETLGFIHRIYDQNFELDTRDLVEFHKKIIDEIDTFKILRFNAGR